MKQVVILFLLIPCIAYSLTLSRVDELSIPGVSNTSFHWGDFDNDGLLDLLITGYDGTANITKLYKNNGGYSFTEIVEVSIPGLRDGSVAWGDYNNDGYLDLIICGATQSTLPMTKLYKNNGNSTFTEVSGTTFVGVKSSVAKWVDYNNDGWLDLFLTGELDSGIKTSRIYRNNQGLGFEWQTDIVLPNISSGDAVWGDLDNDGYQDLIITGNSDGTRITKIYFNNNGLGFVEQGNAQLPQIYYSALCLGDYDNDGWLDFLLIGTVGSTRYAQVYRNNQNKTFTLKSQIKLAPTAYGRPIWADLDNDGKLDIVLTGEESFNKFHTKIYLNQGNDFFTEQTDVDIPGFKNSDLAAVDLNNSGKLDLILAGLIRLNNTNTREFLIYRNDNNKANTPPSAPANLNVNLNGKRIIFSWDASKDQDTPDKSLTYNIVILNQTDPLKQLMYPMADLQNGKRRISAPGNIGNKTHFSTSSLKDGYYQWCVQALDSNHLASPFSAWGYFVVDSSNAEDPILLRIILTNGEITLKWGSVAGAARYRIYSTEDPHTNNWAILAESVDTEYRVPKNNPRQFFRVTAIPSIE